MTITEHIGAPATHTQTGEPTAAVEAPPARRQPGVLVELILADREELVTVRVTNVDRIAYEKTGAKHKEWPAEGRSWSMTFVTWTAAKRAGLTAATFEAWQELLLDWDVVEETPADPTRRAPSPAATSS